MIARLVDAIPLSSPPARGPRAPKACVRCAKAIRYGRSGSYVPASPSICLDCYRADHALHWCPCDGCGACE